jgi:hypothetical protein
VLTVAALAIRNPTRTTKVPAFTKSGVVALIPRSRCRCGCHQSRGGRAAGPGSSCRVCLGNADRVGAMGYTHRDRRGRSCRIENQHDLGRRSPRILLRRRRRRRRRGLLFDPRVSSSVERSVLSLHDNRWICRLLRASGRRGEFNRLTQIIGSSELSRLQVVRSAGRSFLTK